MILSTTTGDLRSHTQTEAEAVDLFAQTPFRHLDFNLQYGLNGYLQEKDYLSEPLRAMERAQKLGMDFVQSHAPSFNIARADCDWEQSAHLMVRCLEICARLHIPHTVMHTSSCREIQYADGQETYFRLNRAFLERIYPAMEKYGVGVLIENGAEHNMFGAYYFMGAREMVEFMEYCGHPLLGCCWDTGHANMRYASQFEQICILGRHLKGMHIQDNFGVHDEHISPLMGTTDFDGVLRALKTIGYTGPFSLEVNSLYPANRGWPHPVRQDGEGERRLLHPPLEARLCAEQMIYAIGKQMLMAYDSFEES